MASHPLTRVKTANENGSLPTLRSSIVGNKLQTDAKTIAAKLFNVLSKTSDDDWRRFSNHTDDPAQSLEGWHDDIHVLVGVFMGSTSYAAVGGASYISSTQR